ncbi:MAG: phage holin family protein [Flammeovirgaceae bacterium]|nr:phage holin family protein [Flammeovirgaceae bacterium]
MEEKYSITENKAINRLLDNAVGFIETYIKIIQLELRTGVASALTILILISLVLIFISFIILFFSLGCAYFISSILHISYSGFFIVALFYVLLLVIIMYYRNAIKRGIDQVLENQLKSPDKIENGNNSTEEDPTKGS